MSQRSAYTLVEILVVVAIIVVLIGFLLPTISKVRIIAERANCASRLHSWGMALTGYAQDHRGQVPVTYYYYGAPDPMHCLTGNYTNATNFEDATRRNPMSFAVIEDYFDGSVTQTARGGGRHWSDFSRAVGCPNHDPLRRSPNLAVGSFSDIVGGVEWAETPGYLYFAGLQGSTLYNDGSGKYLDKMNIGKEMTVGEIPTLTGRRLESTRLVMSDWAAYYQGKLYAMHIKNRRGMIYLTNSKTDVIDGANQLWGDGRVQWKEFSREASDAIHEGQVNPRGSANLLPTPINVMGPSAGRYYF